MQPMVDTYIAFSGSSLFARGSKADVTAVVTAKQTKATSAPILVFEESSGRQIDLDLRPDASEHTTQAGGPPSPGRPKLGVIGREITLLPRHWDWLSTQPGGASITLRKLVENAMRTSSEKDTIRNRQEACYRFVTAIAGNLPGYEEALRSLFANSKTGFSKATSAWPADIRTFALHLGFPKT
jgi:hypothetical protein